MDQLIRSKTIRFRTLSMWQIVIAFLINIIIIIIISFVEVFM